MGGKQTKIENTMDENGGEQSKPLERGVEEVTEHWASSIASTID